MTDQSPTTSSVVEARPARRYRIPALLLGMLSGSELLIATAFAAGAMLLGPGAVVESDAMHSDFSAIVDLLGIAAIIFAVIGIGQLLLTVALWRERAVAVPLTYAAAGIGAVLGLLLVLAGLNGTGVSFFEVSLLVGYIAVGGTLLGARRG